MQDFEDEVVEKDAKKKPPYKQVLVQLLNEAIAHQCECPPWEDTHLGDCKQFHAQRELEMFVGDTPEKLLELILIDA